MAVFRLNWNEPAPAECRGALIAIGNFDGVHRGHVALIELLQKRAAECQTAPVAITFDPHPLAILRPELFQPMLTTVAERARLLQLQGAAHVVVLQTQAGLLRLSARDFFERVIGQSLQARGLVEGPNFGFGYQREGNVETLSQFCHDAGLSFEVVEPFRLDDVVVSSSKVRQALVDGDVSHAAHLLGRPYRLEGVVAAGQHRGQQLGFPTANLASINTLIPKDGVYAVRANLDDVSWPAAANVGPNPTFGEQVRKVEVHLVGFSGGELYGRNLKIDFLKRLRDTRRFVSVDQLLEQIREDVERVNEILAAPVATAKLANPPD